MERLSAQNKCLHRIRYERCEKCHLSLEACLKEVISEQDHLKNEKNGYRQSGSVQGTYN